MLVRVLWLVATLLLLGLGAWGASKYHYEIFDQRSRLHLLMDPALAERTGMIHGKATVVSAFSSGLPPCTIEYRVSKTNYYHIVADGAGVTFADGRRMTVLPHQPLAFFDASSPRIHPNHALRARVLARKPGVPLDAAVACLSATESVYVQGCVSGEDPNHLFPCPGDDAVYLLPGSSATPMITTRAGGAIAWLGFGLLGLLLAIGMAWFYGSFTRPIVKNLVSHARTTARSKASKDIFGYVLIATVLLMAIGVLAIRGGSGWYLVTMGVVLAGACFLWFLVGVRFRRLTAALRVVRGTASSRLSDPGVERQELAVRVSSTAPRVDAVLGPAEPAFVRATILEIIKQPTKKSYTMITRTRAVLAYPRWLPIEDDTGSASLDMKDCQLDAVEERSLVQKGGVLQLPEWAAEILETPIEPSKRHEAFRVRWMTLYPGDPLLIYGQVGRITPGPEHGQAIHAAAGYRTAPIAFAVQGRTVAYMGDEKQLDRRLRNERRAIIPLATVLLASLAATIAACFHASTLV